MLDKNLKPYVLEINHSPSFSTDSPLDRAVKKAVIHDTLVLMNVTARERKRFFAD
jgi:tubulin polyglutamylase TTLL6/13